MRFVGTSNLIWGLMLMAPMCLPAADSSPIRMYLWPDGVPEEAIVHEGDEQIENRDVEQNSEGLNRAIAKVGVPELIVYLAPDELATGVAVVVCPGGGYHHLAIDKEGHDVARRLNEFGITAIVLKYRTWPANVERGSVQAAKVMEAILADGRQAIRVTREHAEQWNIDPTRIGIIGFSAGGHLAAMVVIQADVNGTSSELKRSARPDFVGLIYPGVPEDIEAEISSDTPPMFIANAGDDTVTRAANSIHLYEILQRHGIEAELHVYARGGHGFGLGVRGGAVTSWPDRFVDWLRDLGVLVVEAQK